MSKFLKVRLELWKEYIMVKNIVICNPLGVYLNYGKDSWQEIRTQLTHKDKRNKKNHHKA